MLNVRWFAAMIAAAPLLAQQSFDAQAAAGKTAYGQSCSQCHGAELDDGEFAPPLRGELFARSWGNKPVEELFTYTRQRMPPSNPGGLGDAVYAQIVAHLLASNGIKPSPNALPTAAAALRAFTIPAPPTNLPPQAPRVGGPSGGLSPYYKDPLPAVQVPDLLAKYTPVTEAMLANPAPGEWLTWRRGYDGLGYSPLRQINRTNVANLRLAWSWQLAPGTNENTPLVHDGVLFVHAIGDKVQALNAATGDLLWQYARQLPQGINPASKRAISLYGDKVYTATSDAHVIALDAKTGKVVWDTALEEKPSEVQQQRQTVSGGPLVAKGKVLVGTNSRGPGGSQIVGFDAETGKLLWRFHTIAQPGEPGDNTWNDLPLTLRNGASVWVPGSYDPETGLAYFGIAQTYDTGPLRIPVNKPGITNDALYTDSTVALNPDTGKLVWYYQHLPNDQWDLDWVFERQIVNVNYGGKPRKLVLSAGKAAIYDAVDAKDGKYAFSFDSGMQNFITGIDPVTGAKKIDVSKVPGDGEVKMVCPHAGGSKNWLPASFNPVTKMLYTPLVESCMDLFPVQGRGALSTGVNWALRPRPSSDGKYGRLQAYNLETKRMVWVERHRAPESTGALDTAGGVVFSGSIDRFLRAFDDANGKLLWQTRLSDVPSSAPITFTAGGKQYLAVVTGNGGAQAITFPVLVPEIKTPPDRGSTLWVFEVPGRAR